VRVNSALTGHSRALTISRTKQNKDSSPSSSLERIHTFNLAPKSTPKKNRMPEITGQDKDD